MGQAQNIRSYLLSECDTIFDLGSKSDPEEGSIAEDIATNLFDQENYSLQVKFNYFFVFKFICIPDSFNTNISQQLFDYTINFVNSQH